MHCEDYLKETRDIAIELEALALEAFATELAGTRTMRGKVWVIAQ